MRRPLTYGSVCSGIEAASQAWHPLGYQAKWFSEIEPFCCTVLDYRWPGVPNLGDMTKILEHEQCSTVDILVGGTPCQSFSVAGLRKGLDDPRGNLMLQFLRLARQLRPKWLVWENVPGVLSVNGGGDFATFLRGLEECGYGWAYRVLDAQHFGVPQRRRRVFVVASLRGWQSAFAVLHERGSLFGHPAPSQASAETVASDTGASPACFRWSNDREGLLQTRIAATLKSRSTSTDPRHVAAYIVNAEGSEGLPSLTRSNVGKLLNNQSPLVCFTQNGREELRVLNKAAALMGQQGTHQQTYVAAVPVMPTLMRSSHNSGPGQCVDTVETLLGQPIADTLTASWHMSRGQKAGKSVGMINPVISPDRSHIRRLTPRECERLQGFPDDYTLIPEEFLKKHTPSFERWLQAVKDYGLQNALGRRTDLDNLIALAGRRYRRRKPADYAESIEYLTESGYTLAEAQARANCPDGPRYAALGNSMAVPVMRWIGERIQMVDDIIWQ